MKKLNLVDVQYRLEELEKIIFSVQDIKLLFKASNRAISGFLSYNVKKGKIIKLKKNLYSLRKTYLNSYLIANLAYKPSYISFESALAFYHIIPETVYSIISATSLASRSYAISDKEYLYRKIKKSVYTGYKTLTIEKEKIFIATPEKALADYCYFFYLKKIKNWNDRIDFSKINKKLFLNYLKLFNNPRLINYIKNYLSI